MTIASLRSQLRRRPAPRAADARPSAQLDEIGPAPAGIAAAPGAPGAPLHEVLVLVQQRVPGATGMMIRDGLLHVAYDGPVDDAVRAVVRDAIAERFARPGEKP